MSWRLDKPELDGLRIHMVSAPEYQLIESQSSLEAYCESIQNESLIAFDTEFVSEDRYLPQLCLLQIAAGNSTAIVDPIRIGNNLETFWKLLAESPQTSIAHAGREEFRFCHRFSGSRPGRFADVQIGAGLVGLEYPAAYSTLVSKLAGKSLAKGETRSDWRRRPLSNQQLAYAALDVAYLEKIYGKIGRRLETMDRLNWLDEEMENWQSELETTFNDRESWRRISGISTLDQKSLAIARSLWQWRESTASERDLPARRILRDDLLVELSKRGQSAIHRIKVIRGMERRQYQRHLGGISAAIQEALELTSDAWPKRRFTEQTPQLGQLGQFLTTALGIICKQTQIAPGLFGSTSELRQLAAWKLGIIDRPQSRLLSGWRGELVLPVIDRLLDGHMGMRIANAKHNEPLELFEFDTQRPQPK